jgi:hypothetical protein
MAQLNVALERRRSAGRHAPRSTTQLILGPQVVDALMRAKPLTQAELDKTHIPNFSKNKSKQYGQQILATMQQVMGIAYVADTSC